MDVTKYYNYEYEDLKYRIKYLYGFKDDELNELISDKTIKNKLINDENKYNFIWFVQEVNEDIIADLLDGDGFELLSKTDYLDDKLNAFITSSNANKAMLDEKMQILVLEHYDKLKMGFSSFDEKVSNDLFLKAKTNEKIGFDIISTFVDSSQLYVLKNNSLNTEQIKEVLPKVGKNSVLYLLDISLDDSLLNDFSYGTLMHFFSNNKVSDFFLENDYLLEKFSTISDPKDYRFLIFSLEKKSDSSIVEKKRKKYYDEVLNSYNPDSKMLDKYENVYNLFCEKKVNGEYVYLDDLVDNINFFNDNTKHQILWELNKHIDSGDIEEVRNFLIEESNIEVGNIIIDYNFEEVYANFFKDVKQLIKMDDAYHFLDTDSLKAYSDLLKIDSISVSDKLLLHEKLKQSDMISKYYDDMREAKDMAYLDMKDRMLTDQKLDGLKSNELSLKYGVDIFELKGEPYYTLSKSYSLSKEYVFSKDDFRQYTDAGSYSLTGGDNIDTFRNPKEYYNFCYSDFDIENVIHTFSVDSFSNYRSLQNDATKRVHELYTPDDLIKSSSSYSEVIIKQNNQKLDGNEVNDKIKNPELLGLLCYDEICENDVLTAKENNVGIVLVHTKDYPKNLDVDAINMLETMTLSGGEFDYLEADDRVDVLSERRSKR